MMYPAPNPEIQNLRMIVQQEMICLARAPNFKKEFKKIEKELDKAIHFAEKEALATKQYHASTIGGDQKYLYGYNAEEKEERLKQAQKEVDDLLETRIKQSIREYKQKKRQLEKL